jgi:hypothetical protein
LTLILKGRRPSHEPHDGLLVDRRIFLTVFTGEYFAILVTASFGNDVIHMYAASDASKAQAPLATFPVSQGAMS